MSDHTPGQWSWNMDDQCIATLYGAANTAAFRPIADFWRRALRGDDIETRTFAEIQAEQVANVTLCAKAPDMHAALRLALPVMRRTAAEYLDSVMVRSDPATIAAAEWEEIAPDLEAIVAAEACVGRVTEPSWLDAIIDAGKWREGSGK